MRTWIRNNRGLLTFIFCLGLFRTAVADWNPVPTGSMRPTILEGDVVLVNRLAYDLKIPLTNLSLARLGEPQRGDIATFSSPKDGTRLIKRIVGLPGDTIEVRNNRLYVNGQRAAYTELERVTEEVRQGIYGEATRQIEQINGNRRQVQFFSTRGSDVSFGPVQIPADQFFMMGDNRNNSEDSRYIGFIPRENLIGQAGHVLVSADIKRDWSPRLDRTLSRLDQE
ncbi:signal peptidase I [Dokdonella sp.]|uniref:signal peptidase I n=1 Tax=Dokdonella sp. TaxID=2291710 RepID=UPI003C57FAB7